MSSSVAIRFNAQTQEAEKAFTNLTRTASGFEKSFAGIASSLEGHQQRINRAFEQFSGDKLIREASELARAVEKVGGASRLTATEQQNVNKVLTEAIAKYQALGLTAPKALLDLANATKQVQQPTSALSSALGGVFAQFTAANLAASAISKLVGGIGDLVSQGAKLPGLEGAFGRLSAGVGQDSTEMLSTLQAATKGLVSNIDLMQSANKAILLGLPVTSKEMGELAQSATALGKAMGLDATQSLNDLITALGRSSPLILDNLGLTVKVGEANDAYAAKLGKTAEQLTDAEKKTAFYEAAMEAARRKTKELGDQTLTLGEIATIAWNKFGDAVTGAVGVFNSQIPKLLSDGDRLIEFLKLMAISSPGQALAALSAKDRAIAEDKARRAAAAKGGEPSLEAFLIAEAQALEDLEKKAARLASGSLKALTERQRDLAIQFDKGGLSAKEIADELNKVGITSGVTETQIKKLTDGLKKSEKEADKFAAAMKAIAAAQVPLTDAQKQQVLALRDYPGVLDELAKKLGVSAEAIKKWLNGVKEATPALNNLKRATADYARIVTGIDQIAEVPADRITGLRTGRFDALLGIDEATGRAKNLLDQLRRDDYLEWVKHGVRVGQIPINPKVEPGFFAKAFGGDFGTQLGSSIMAAIQGGGSVSGAIGGTIGQALTSELGKSLTKAFPKMMEGALGKMVSAMLPGLGALLGPLTEKIVGLIGKAFDRNKGRDLVKTFAESFGGFDALQRKLETLGAEGARLWIQLTQGVGRNNPEQARAAIDAVTAAFSTQAQTLADTKREVTGLIQTYVGAGTQIPAALQAMIDKAIDLGAITADNASELLGLATVAVPSFADISKAAETLGVNIDAIGESVKNIRFAEQADDIAAAFKTLEDAGADMTAVFEQSAPKVQDIVTEALKFGRQLPESMRPFLDRMAKLGLLSDDTGEKLTDLSRLNFAEPLTKKIDDLIVKIGELIEKITGGIGGALDNLSKRSVTVPVRFSYDTDTGSASVSTGSLPSPESGSTTVILEMDSYAVAEAVVPQIPGVVQRYGLAGV